MLHRRTPVYIIIFSLLGAICAYMSLHAHTLLVHGISNGPSACNIGPHFNCDTINKSEFSVFMGVPLAAIGLIYYSLALLGALLCIPFGLGEAALGIYLLASTASVILSLYLFYIAEFVLGTLCLFCVGMYVANIGIFLSVVLASKGAVGRLMRQGIFAPGEFLLSLVKGPRRAQAWTFLVIGSLVIPLILRLPDLISGTKEKAQAPLILSIWKKEPTVNIAIKKGGPLDGDYTKGLEGASIEVIEYSDFECPACRVFYPEMERLIKKYDGKLSFTAKSFPLDKECNRLIDQDMHKNSCKIAAWVRCAGEQGKFWEAYDEAFTSKALEETEGTDPSNSGQKDAMEALYAWSMSSGFDVDALKECVESGRQLQKIKSDIEEGISHNLQSTPSVYVNGRRTSASQLEVVIEALLKLHTF